MRVLLALLLLPLAGCANGLLLLPTYVGGPVVEREVTPASKWLCHDKIALIDVEGVIVNARTGGLLSSGENPVSLFRERLDAAACDKNVKAVVLRVNTPGGAVTASDIMHRDLVNFRKETGKPVVACFMDVAASGGYYVAMAADRIYAHPTTVTGSIGVIMNLYNAHGLLKTLGVTGDAIKSGPNKDIGNPTRPMTAEERAILQKIVSGFHEQFVEVVAEGRKHCLSVEQVRGLADGRVYTGKEAKVLGLVDEVGYLEDAFDCALQLAGLCDAAVVAYDGKGCGHRGSIYAGGKIPTEFNVKVDVPGLSRLDGMMGGGFYYLWEAGR